MGHMKILITGGTGFLGSLLSDELIRQGHDLILACRSIPETMNPYPARFVSWPLDKNELQDDLPKIEACIHLAGEPIAGKRWSEEQKNRIYDSRINGTRSVVDLLREAPKLKVFLSGSAVGFYGDQKDADLNELSAAGDGFLAEVCRDWETEAKKLTALNLRLVLLRTGVVLGRGNGFLREMEPLFQNGVAGPVGSGGQFISWIHVDDWIKALIFCLNTEKISGPVNLTAPNPCTNRTFTYTLGDLFNQKVYPPAPEMAINLALGEMAAIALQSQKALPKALTDLRFEFRFPELKMALEHIFELSESNRSIDDYFSTQQWVPASIEKVFGFFSDEKNLERITPPLLNFSVEKKSTAEIGQGTLIDYKLKIHGFPAKWRTRIETWNPPHEFTDTQLKGPYSKWYHTHTFESFRGGVLMKDRVLYRLPMGFLGRLGGLWLVKRDVDEIFNYRRKVIREMFPN